MPDLSAATNEEIIAELVGREDFTGIVVTVDSPDVTRRDIVSQQRPSTMPQRRAIAALQTAASQLENGAA